MISLGRLGRRYLRLKLSNCCLKQYATDAEQKLACSMPMPKPDPDFAYLCDTGNKTEIERNIKLRKGVGDINTVCELHAKINSLATTSLEELEQLKKQLDEQAVLIPNKSHPILTEYGEDPKLINVKGEMPIFSFKPKEFSEIARKYRLLRNENIGVFSGHRSYYFTGELAELEQALVRFTVRELLQRNFKLVSVPDILPRQLIEGCGMSTKGERTQVYSLDSERHGEDICLSGTSEMALAGYVMNRVFEGINLPEKLAAVSRCFRAETSRTAQERGIYRVHQFTKVEMFGVSRREDSGQLLAEFCQLQEELFTSLGLHTQTLDMPLHELGAPAYRKHDIEAWMPGRGAFGEISSCSDCTDYQARRLSIRYTPSPEESPDSILYAHTVNGTACAVPRMLIALIETHQQEDGKINIPVPLRPYMRGKTHIGKQDTVPSFKLIRQKEVAGKRG